MKVQIYFEAEGKPKRGKMIRNSVSAGKLEKEP
jgi:hypothetical protein